MSEPMKNYEVTFIVDPVLSGDEIKATAQTYIDHLKGEGCTIVHVDDMGLRQLAYPINRRSSGVYFCVEISSESGAMIPKMELALRRDERIMRFLTVSLDKYGVKYNEDKRNGLIGKRQEEEVAEVEEKPARSAKPAPKAKTEAPKAKAKTPAPKEEAPAPEAKVEEAAPEAKAETPAPEAKAEEAAPEAKAEEAAPEAKAVKKEEE